MEKKYSLEKNKLENNIKMTVKKLNDLETVQKNNEELSNNKIREIEDIKKKYK